MVQVFKRNTSYLFSVRLFHESHHVNFFKQFTSHRYICPHLVLKPTHGTLCNRQQLTENVNMIHLYSQQIWLFFIKV